MPTSTRNFLEALACEAASNDIPGVPFDDLATYRKLGCVLALIRDAAIQLLNAGQTEDGDELLELVEDLTPDSNTGAYDNFLARLRALQPTFAKVENPTQYSMKFDVDEAVGRAVLHRTAPRIRDLAARCADQLR